VKSAEELINRQYILLELAKSLSRIKDLKKLLNYIADRTSEIMDVERCSVFLLDNKTNELWSIIATGEDEEIRFSADKGISGYVCKTGETLIINNPREDHRWNPDIDKETGFITESLLTVPIYDHDDNIMGVFQVLNKRVGEFENEDVEMLSAVASQVSIAIQNTLALEKREKMFESLLETMAETIDMRDPLTAGHSRNVMRLSTLIAEELGLSEDRIKVIRYSAYLHDYGKVGIDDKILKKPGKLTISERREVKKHADFTKRILIKIDFEDELSDIADIAYLHHERIDGSGYPLGIEGEDIPLETRIITVSDVFDALTSKRHYRERLSREKAYEYLLKWVDVKFDKDVVDALGVVLKREGEFVKKFVENHFLENETK
jgi:HD-GYP domain-containing protein (c-di-GMP phosphodiesterase class II)